MILSDRMDEKAKFMAVTNTGHPGWMHGFAEEVRKREAVIRAAERAMTNRNETNSEAYFIEVENRIAELENA